jgi:predicted metalloprotease
MSFNEGVSIDTSHASRGGGGGRGPVMIGGGIGTIVIVIIAMLLGVDPGAILGGSPQQDAGQLQDARAPPPTPPSIAAFWPPRTASTRTGRRRLRSTASPTPGRRR